MYRWEAEHASLPRYTTRAYNNCKSYVLLSHILLFVTYQPAMLQAIEVLYVHEYILLDQDRRSGTRVSWYNIDNITNGILLVKRSAILPYLVV